MQIHAQQTNTKQKQTGKRKVSIALWSFKKWRRYIEKFDCLIKGTKSCCTQMESIWFSLPEESSPKTFQLLCVGQESLVRKKNTRVDNLCRNMGPWKSKKWHIWLHGTFKSVLLRSPNVDKRQRLRTGDLLAKKRTMVFELKAKTFRISKKEISKPILLGKEIHINFYWFLECITSKLEKDGKTFSSFNRLPSSAEDFKHWIQCINKVFEKGSYG